MPTEKTAEDRLAARRLTGLLDYVEALVKLDERVRQSEPRGNNGDEGNYRQPHAMKSVPDK